MDARGLKGTVADGTFTPDAAAGAQAGLVKATVGALTGDGAHPRDPAAAVDVRLRGRAARRRRRSWVNATGKFAVRDARRQKVLVKLRREPFASPSAAGRSSGPDDCSDYTIEADVRARRRRRQMGDVGIIAQRYALVLFGNHQQLELQPWQPETQRTVKVPFAWKADTWYT